MRISSLRYFYEVAQLKSISKISNNLHISQPALSHQISKLEKYLGVKLLERSNKGVELTTKGQVMYKYAKQILVLYDNLIKEISNDELMSKELKITISNLHANFLLNKVISDVNKIFKNTNININYQTDSNEKALLIHNRTNIIVGCTYIEDTDLVCNYIGSDKLILVSSKEIKYENIKNIPIAILEDNSNIIKDNKKQDIDFNINLKTNSLDVIKSYLKNENVAAILPKIAIEKELQDNSLIQVCSDEYEIDYDLYMTYRKDIDIEFKSNFKLLKNKLELILIKKSLCK